MLNEITSCEVCRKNELYSILDLGTHPMCDDLVAVGDERICTEYPIEILFCDTCLTAHQRFQIPKQTLFPQTYHYRARHTADVLNGMRSLVESCEQNYGHLSEKKVLDVGCNDGSLLSFFREKQAKTYGIEPTGAYKDAQNAGHEVIHDFFCERVADELEKKYGTFDLITFTNVFAHIEDLADVIRGLKRIMHVQTIIVIENHYLGAILEKFQFDTFYHEHPRTYSCTSFAYIAESLGLKIGKVEFPARYNGNIRIAYVPKNSVIGQDEWQKIHKQEKSFAQHLKTMAKKIEPWRQEKRTFLEMHVNKYGKLNAKAFPGRAAILVKMLNLGAEHIKAVYEKPQSGKIGHYVPGTRIPILSDDVFDPADNTAPILNLAWHISAEIRSYLKELGYTGAIIDIINQKDMQY